jgi:hypothetical protein
MTDTIERHVLEQVRPELVPAVWAKIPDLIEKACAFSGGRFEPGAVLAACAGQNPALKWQMWLVFDPKASPDDFAERVKAVAVSNLARYPTGLLVGEIILIAGRGHSSEWLVYVDALKEWARVNGADRLQFIGRRGFQRMLGTEWRQAATMYEFDLKDGGNGLQQ